MLFLCLWPCCDKCFATIMVLLLCLFFHFANGLATIFIFAIFSNFTFENGFAMISNFTFADGFDTISNFAFANDFDTISNFAIFSKFAFAERCLFSEKSDFHERSLQRKLFLARKDMFQKQRIETNCFNCFA